MSHRIGNQTVLSCAPRGYFIAHRWIGSLYNIFFSPTPGGHDVGSHAVGLILLFLQASMSQLRLIGPILPLEARRRISAPDPSAGLRADASEPGGGADAPR